MAHNRKSTKQKQFCNIAQWAGETGWGEISANQTDVNNARGRYLLDPC